MSKLVVIGSLSSGEQIESIENVFADMFDEIVTPLDNQKGSLEDICRSYYVHIKTADVIVAIPKEIRSVNENSVPTQRKELYFGESTTYEMAIAKEEHIPIIIWNDAPSEVSIS